MGRTGSGHVERRIRYTPLPSQETFHRLGHRFKGFSGPVGSGKSQALCQEALRLSYLNPGRTGLLGAPTYPMLRDATQAAFLGTLEENRIPYRMNKSESTVVLLDTKSRVLLRAVDQYERLRGTNLAWFGLDELTYCRKEAWERLEARLRDPKARRLCGFAVWTPKGFDWVYDRFVDNAVTGYGLVKASPFENRFVLDEVPDYYERLRHSYDEAFFQQEVLGEYRSNSSGRVYTAFDRALHLGDVTVDTTRPLLWALDFNVDPMCSVVAQVVGRQVRVLDEILLSHATTAEACEEFQRRFPDNRMPVVVYGDASGNRRQTSGESDYQMVRSFFRRVGRERVTYNVPEANPLVRERVGLMNAKMKSAAGDVEMVVSGRCRELMKDFEQVAYKDHSGQIDKAKDPRRTHLSDALGYLVWQECKERDAGERGGRGRLF